MRGWICIFLIALCACSTIKTPSELSYSKCPDKKSKKINERLSRKIIKKNLKKEEEFYAIKNPKEKEIHIKKDHYKNKKMPHNNKKMCPKFR